MILGKLFQPFVENSPISIMARATLENALSCAALDHLFKAHAERQYTRELLFSSVVDAMGLVVSRVEPSIHAAYQSSRKEFSVSVQSLYNKLDGIEPSIGRTMVQYVSKRTSAIVEKTGAVLPEMLPGHRVRILDGNHLAHTQHRLRELRKTAAGPLPGFALAVLDPVLRQVIDAIPCEDGHAQERSLAQEILAMVEPNDAWIDDRNFCTSVLLFGIADKGAFFVTRQHRINVPWKPIGKRTKCGKIEGSTVWEQQVKLRDGAGRSMLARRITLELEKATRDGDMELHILTNLPPSTAATRVGGAYRGRWSIELAFQELEATLDGEIETLGYPKAALFAFAVALTAYNIHSVIKAALRAKHGTEKVEEEVSQFYVAKEIAQTTRGMLIAIPPSNWRAFEDASATEMASLLLDLAGKVDMRTLLRHPRGPKKPQPKRTSSKRHPHVSTARLLALRKRRKRAP